MAFLFAVVALIILVSAVGWLVPPPTPGTMLASARQLARSSIGWVVLVANCSVLHAVATELCPGACLFLVVKYNLFYELDTTIDRLQTLTI